MTSYVFCIEMIVIMGVGVLAVRTKMVPENFSAPFARLTLNFLVPCSILSSMLEMSAEPPAESNIFLIGLGVAILAISALVSVLLMLVHPTSKTDRSLFLAGITFMNMGIFGFPLVKMFFGPQGIHYTNLMFVPLQIISCVTMPYIMCESHRNEFKAGGALKAVLRSLLHPMSLCGIIGLTLYLLRVSPPPVVRDLLDRIGGTALPIGMVLCGITIGNIKPSHFSHRFGGFLCALARNIIAPAAVWLIFSLFGISGLLLKIAVLFAAMPVPITLTMFAAQDEAQTEHASIITFFSMTMSVVTIPGFLLLLDMFVPM